MDKCIKLVLGAIFMLMVVFSCSYSNIDNQKLEYALSLSGDNRSELEKVLAYYSKDKKDSLKYKAAVFLIQNMPGHYSYSSNDYKKIEGYYRTIDSISTMRSFLSPDRLDSVYDAIKLRDENFEIIEDINIISSEYLINNIESAFNVWEDVSFSQQVDFENFCEYILPYKGVECQTLDNWRYYLSTYGANSIRDIQCSDLFKHSTYRICEAITNALRDSVVPRIIPEFNNRLIIRKMSTLEKVPFGTCDEYAFLTLSAMRAKGIACAIDFVPQWPFRSLGHSWNVFLDNSGKMKMLELFQPRPGMPHKEDHKKAKVLRHTYSINEEVQELLKEERHVPPSLRNMHVKDVTHDYVETIDVVLENTLFEKYKYAYLTVFNNVEWVPIYWGKIKRDRAIFNKMGKGIVYLPIVYSAFGMTPVSAPFILDYDGTIKYLTPNQQQEQSLQLNRKYPYLHHPQDNLYRIIGGQIQASNTVSFQNYETIATINKTASYPLTINLIDNNETYRFWRYYSPDSGYCNIAELYFYEKGSNNPLRGRVIGTEGHGKSKPEAAFDNDPLTFFDASEASNCWVGMDFEEEVNIDKILYLARGDGNNIEIGNEYELMYWKNTDWKSLGRVKADSFYVKYNNCPSNALFLLHNRTHGKEERIFTYENGKIVWW